MVSLYAAMLEFMPESLLVARCILGVSSCTCLDANASRLLDAWQQAANAPLRLPPALGRKVPRRHRRLAQPAGSCWRLRCTCSLALLLEPRWRLHATDWQWISAQHSADRRRQHR